jgi:hypothetical protein
MLASILIIVFSLVLFVYWFRYSCILLLRSRADQPAAEAADGFQYADVQQQLPTAVELDPLHRALDRDYKVLTYLSEHAAGLKLERVEYRLLVLDYKVMRGWYRLTRSSAPQQARRALAEMADILGVLVGRIGEQAGARREA